MTRTVFGFLAGLGLTLAVQSAAEARFIERLPVCKAQCGAQVAAGCAGLRRARFARCRLRVWTQCRKFGRPAICPSPTTTVTPTTVPPSAPTTSTTTTTVAVLPPTTSTLPAPACGGNLLLFADDGTGTYLGCITCSNFAQDSIFNEFGPYGSQFSSTSVNNQFGTYGNPFGAYSACNQFSQHPPVIADEATCLLGRFTVNPYLAGSVCGIPGSATLCDAVAALCAQ
jgi:hypothetical protein